MEKARIDFYRRWHGKSLEDWGCYVSEEYKSFQRSFRILLKKIANDLGAELVWYHPNHYDETAMFQRGNRFVYLSHSNNLCNRSTPILHHILIRTAEHEKDYHGGSNNYANWAELTNAIDRLLGGRGEIEDCDLFPPRQQFPFTNWDTSY